MYGLKVVLQYNNNVMRQEPIVSGNINFSATFWVIIQIVTRIVVNDALHRMGVKAIASSLNENI